MPAIFLAIFVDVLGFSIILPGLPYVTLHFGGTAITGMAMMSVFSIAALIFSPLLGRLSDRLGRRPVLLMTFSGAILAYSTLAFADTLLMLFVARFMSGAMAGNVAIAMASIADSTSFENRGKMMGLFGGVYGVAFAIGPGVGGLVSGNPETPSLLFPGLIAASMALLALIITFFFFNPKKRTDAEKIKAQEKIPYRLVVPDKRSALLMSQFTLSSSIQSIVFPITPFWCIAVLNWSLVQVGWLLMMIGGAIAFVQGGLVPILFSKLGEIRTFLLGFFMTAIAAGLMAFLPDGEWKAWTLIPMIASGATIAFPALNTTLSKRTDDHAQGTALGLGNGLSFLGRIAGPLVGGWLFETFYPGAPFIVIMIAGVIAIGWAISELLRGNYVKPIALQKIN